MIVFYSDDEELKEIGRTEIQKATQSPNFVTTFRVTYSFEKQSNYRFDLYGMKHSNTKSLLRQAPLGNAKYSIHEIVCAPDKKLARELSKGGIITVFSEELSKLNHKIKLKLGFESKKKAAGVFSVRISRTGNNRDIPVYITEGVDGIPCSI